jgi:hypothetical protein
MTLHDRNRRYTEVVNQAKRAAGILRKSRNLEVLGFICPGNALSLRLLGHVLHFNHFEDAQALLAGEGFDLGEDVKLLVPLLEQPFVSANPRMR